MRNFVVFIFWFLVLLSLVGGIALAIVSYTAEAPMSNAQLGYRAGRMLGIWMLLIPWFGTWCGWYFGFLPFFKSTTNADSASDKPNTD